MLKQTGIYKIENKVNGKVYIGQSVNIRKRIMTHKYNANNPKIGKAHDLYIYSAIRKHGIENFDFSIVELCDKSELDEKERYWIAYYKSNQSNHGYNLNDGGNSIYVKHLKSDSNVTPKKHHIEEIKKLLTDTDLSIQEIAKRYNMTTASITNINRGHSWHNEDSVYPLRDTRKKTFYYCQKCGKKLSCKYSKLCKKCDAERQEIVRGHFPGIETFKQDIDNYGLRELSKKYGACEATICKWSKKYNIPLKGWNQTRRLKYEQV